MKKSFAKATRPTARASYAELVHGIGDLLEAARHATARVTNTLMTAMYWEVGRRIVEFEQGGKKRAEYGEKLLKRLAVDLTARLGRGFSRQNLQNMRQFYSVCSSTWICQRLSGNSGSAICQTSSGISELDIRATPSLESICPIKTALPLADIARAFPLPWSHYVLLVGRARSPEAFDFYHTEALRGGWTGPQLDRQINSLFYERTALSRNKAADAAIVQQAAAQISLSLRRQT